MSELLDAVREDPELTPVEKETAIWFDKDHDTAQVFTAEAGLMRRFLSHPETDDVTLSVARGDRARPTVALADYEGGDIVGVSATVPVGTLLVKSEPRKSDGHATVVTKRVFDTDGIGGESP